MRTNFGGLAFVVLLQVVLAASPSFSATGSDSNHDYTPPAEMEAAAVYGFSCSDCHGMKGSGPTPGTPFYESFDSPPADFTDPLFASREPAADWALVIKYGGSSIGLSSEMPAFGDAFSDEQIDALVAYIKSFAVVERYPPGDLNFIRAIETIKAFPEDEMLLITRYSEGKDENPNAWRSTLYYGRRIGARHQGEIKISQLSSEGVDELDEAEIGWKWAVSDDLAAQRLFTVGLEAAFPIDDDNASEEIIPYFSFAKGLSDRFTFQGMLKAGLPTEDVGDGEAKLAGVVHWTRSSWPRGVTPAIEATVTAPFSSGGTEATMTPQVYLGLSKLGHVAVALGVEVPLTGLDYDYRVRSFLLWDIAAGKPWDGW